MRREVVGDALLEQPPDVVQAHVAGGVSAGRLGGQVLLPGALGDDDHGVAAFPHGAAQVREEPVLAVQLERHLRDQHVVGVVLGQRGVAGDEARVPAHQLHQPDAVGRRARLDVRGPDRLGRLARTPSGSRSSGR